MKLGLNYSHCIADIVDSRVGLAEIFLIISDTNFDIISITEPNFDKVWQGYTHTGNAWAKYPDSLKPYFWQLTSSLIINNKICQHQLHRPWRYSYEPINWVNLINPPGDENHSSVKEAWDYFHTISKLTDFNPWTIEL